MGSSLYLIRSLRNLTFCRVRHYTTLMQQSYFHFKKNEVAFLKNFFLKRKFYNSKILFNSNQQGFVSLEESKLYLIEDENYINSLEKIFPFPSQTLKNFYNLSLQDSKNNFKYNCNFKNYGLQHDPIFSCSIQLNGPIYETFQGYGKNKKKAENAAMVKALVLLFEGKHMDSLGRPIKLLKSSRRKEGLAGELLKPIVVSLSDEDLLAAQQLIDHYENNIEPSMSTALANENKSNAEEVLNSVSAGIVNLMTGKKFYETESTDLGRNLQLQQELNKIRGRKDYSLPIYKVTHEIVEAVSNNAVTIIEGGTGCGKSTQVPQMIMDEWTENLKGSECNIIIAQPKRIATLSIARRIAHDRRESIGQSVGYKMRLEEQMLRFDGGFMFYTCGTLREMFRFNPLFEGISHIIIDEVHERTIDTDILLFLLKRTLSQGSPLKVILMSATSRIDELKSYFGTNAVVSVPSGTVFPINTHYIDELPFLLKEKPNVKEMVERKTYPSIPYKTIVALIHHIDSIMPAGAILVFVPGWHDIKTLEQFLFDNKNLHVLPLHSKLSSSLQNRIFSQSIEGKRKVILSTNLAETSLTINDVVYVIDSGLQNDHRLDADRNASSFGTYWISKANAIQRQGRAGRVQRGEVFRLYHEKTYNEMEDYPKPDIQKMPLETVALKFKYIFEDKSVRDVLNGLMSPPHPVAVEKAIEALTHLQLMKSEVGVSNETLTSLGRVLSTFSTSPYFSKPLVYSLLLRCADPVLSYICLESKFMNLFEKPISNSESRNLKGKFDEDSDLLAVAGLVGRIFEDYLGLRNNIGFDIDDDDPEDENEEIRLNRSSNNLNLTIGKDVNEYTLLSMPRVQNILKVRNLLQRQLKCCMPDFQRNLDIREENLEKNSSLILASFLSAASFIIKRVRKKYTGTSKLAAEDSASVLVHSSSVLKDSDFEAEGKDHFFTTEMFYSPIRNTWIAKDLSSIPALSVALFYGEDLQVIRSESADNSGVTLGIKNRNILFLMDERTSKCVLSLRKLWNTLVDYYIESSLNKEWEPNESSGEVELVRDFCDQYQRLLLQLLNGNEVLSNELVIN